MFVDAYRIATEFTRPVVLSARDATGSVEAGLGSFVVLNDQGWIATAAHIFEVVVKQQSGEASLAAYDAKMAKVHAEPNDSRRHAMAKRVKPPSDCVRNHSHWWSDDAARVVEDHVYFDLDLAVCRLAPFDASKFAGFPTFKDPGSLEPGTSLVKIGFPFHDVESSWDDAKGSFQLAPGALPAPYFPMEGIFTRTLDMGMSPQGFPIKFLETSSPGLRGQSGGPTLDTRGVVWAIQAKTFPFALGFSPKAATKDGRAVEEHQFLNVGLGVHPETLHAVFTAHGVNVAWAP